MEISFFMVVDDEVLAETVEGEVFFEELAFNISSCIRKGKSEHKAIRIERLSIRGEVYLVFFKNKIFAARIADIDKLNVHIFKKFENKPKW